MNRKSFVIGGGALVLMLVAGCSKRPQECKQVIDLIDDDDQAVQAAVAGFGMDLSQSAQAAKQLSQVETKLANDLKALTITTPDLKKGVDDYVAAANDAAADTGKIADPMAKLGGNMAAGTDPFSRITTAVNKMVTYCQGSGANHEDCQKVGLAMKQAPTNIDNPQTEAEALNAWLATLKAITPSDAGMKQDLADLESVVQDNIDADTSIATFVTAMKQLKVKADVATNEINTACGAQ
jgi:hypothetical protein